MAKYIEEKELMEWVENWFEKNRYYHPYSKTNDIPIPELYDILEQIPTADVTEINVGKWINTGSGEECSKCHEIQYGYDSFRRYCPNCGAKMCERRDDVEVTKRTD